MGSTLSRSSREQEHTKVTAHQHINEDTAQSLEDRAPAEEGRDGETTAEPAQDHDADVCATVSYPYLPTPEATQTRESQESADAPVVATSRGPSVQFEPGVLVAAVTQDPSLHAHASSPELEVESQPQDHDPSHSPDSMLSTSRLSRPRRKARPHVSTQVSRSRSRSTKHSQHIETPTPKNGNCDVATLAGEAGDDEMGGIAASSDGEKHNGRGVEMTHDLRSNAHNASAVEHLVQTLREQMHEAESHALLELFRLSFGDGAARELLGALVSRSDAVALSGKDLTAGLTAKQKRDWNAFVAQHSAVGAGGGKGRGEPVVVLPLRRTDDNAVGEMTKSQHDGAVAASGNETKGKKRKRRASSQSTLKHASPTDPNRTSATPPEVANESCAQRTQPSPSPGPNLDSASKSHLDSIQFLLSPGPDVDAANGSSPHNPQPPPDPDPEPGRAMEFSAPTSPPPVRPDLGPDQSPGPSEEQNNTFHPTASAAASTLPPPQKKKRTRRGRRGKHKRRRGKQTVPQQVNKKRKVAHEAGGVTDVALRGAMGLMEMNVDGVDSGTGEVVMGDAIVEGRGEIARKDKLFTGASGPVYSRSFLGAVGDV